MDTQNQQDSELQSDSAIVIAVGRLLNNWGTEGYHLSDDLFYSTSMKASTLQ